MKYVSVTFMHKTPLSQFSAMMHIHVAVPELPGEFDTLAAVAKAQRLLHENVYNPEWWQFRGVTAPYDIRKDELDEAGY